MGFRLGLKWGFAVQSPFFTNSSSWPSSYSFGGRETSCGSTRAPSLTSSPSEESETLYNAILKVHTCSFFPQTFGSCYSETEEGKMSEGKRSHCGLYGMVDENIQMPHGEDKLVFLTSLQAGKASHFNLLMENLHMLEETFVDSDAVRLERDIVAQLQRLGALKLFHSYLPKTIKSPRLTGLSDALTMLDEESQMNDPLDDHLPKIVVRSGKKGKRKLRREGQSEMICNTYDHASTLQTNHNKTYQLKSASSRRSLKSRTRKHKITRDEAEMSRGVKLIANLERIRMRLEEETGQAANLSRWAEAAGVNKKALQENLHFGWCCRDELLRSTRSLVIYLSRNYRGVGLAFEDLIQAGNFGVLQGAERFDHTRGYKFSTYVQYWIRKSMSMLVAQHARGIRIPFTLNKAISQILKAQKFLTNRHGKRPDDNEIAKFTGLSLAKISSARKCVRVVGSIDQKVGNYINAKFLEFVPDTSMETPEETVIRQHMIKSIYDLLNGLDTRERQVLVLRFGLGNHPCKSLEEIGKIFNVSKEWIRKIERTALTKLRDKETLKSLNHYIHM